jgi:nicotinamidase-related amidase
MGPRFTEQAWINVYGAARFAPSFSGIATNFGVDSTARAAVDRGYELVSAENAMSSIGAEAHKFTVNNLFPRIGRVRSTEQIVEALA